MGKPLSRILLYKRGWRYERPLEVAGLRAAWAINAPARMSVLLPVRGQVLTGVDWLGRWVWWEHPTMGFFSGYVEDVPIDTGRGVLELGIVDHVNILSKRRTIRRYRPAMGPPGAIIARALSDVTLDAGMSFGVFTSERGPQVKYEFRAGSVMDVFDAMVSASGQEWSSTVFEDRSMAIYWRAQVGRDETDTITFTEGVDIISARIDQTIVNTVNDLLAIADDDQYTRSAGARIQSRGSIGRFGQMQETRRYTGLTNPSPLGPRAAADIKRLSIPTTTITIRIAHLQPKLSSIRDGTVFRFVSASANAVYQARVLAREIDLDNGVVTLTCDAVSDITRAAQLESWQWGGFETAGDA
jgi:hypothetical protein